MKASFAIAGAISPQALVAKPDQSGAFRTTLSSLLPAPAQSPMQAAMPPGSGSPGEDTAAGSAGASNHAVGGASPKTHQGEPALFIGQPQRGIEQSTAETATGVVSNQKPNMPSPARNVLTAATVRSERARYTPESAGGATRGKTARHESLSRHGALDPLPGSVLSVVLSAPASANLQSPEVAKTGAQHTSPQSSQPEIPANTVVSAAPSQMKAAAGAAPTSPCGAYLPHGAAVAPPEASNGTTEPSPGVGNSQATLPGAPALGSYNQGVQTAVSTPPKSKDSHSYTPQTGPAAKPARASEALEVPDRATDRLRVSPPVAPHGIPAPQLKETWSPGASSKVTELTTIPATVLHATAESSRPNGAPVASQAAAQTTISSVLQRMDTAGPGQSLALRADSRQLDVGVQSSTLGWVEVRATSGSSGNVDATIHVQNGALARDIAEHSGNIIAFAREHSVGVGQLSVGVGGGEGGRQEHGHRQQAAGEQERDEPGSPPVSVLSDAPSGLSLISIRA